MIKNKWIDTFICEKYKYIYYSIRKCASTTLKETLEKDIKRADINFNPGKYSNYFQFAIVRNPWDRVVSFYENIMLKKNRVKNTDNDPLVVELFNIHQKDLTFDIFIEKISKKELSTSVYGYRHPMLHIVPCHEFLPKLSYLNAIIHFDKIAEQIQPILKKIRVEKLPRYNYLKRERYQSYYNDWSKSLVADIYSEDIKLFGFKF